MRPPPNQKQGGAVTGDSDERYLLGEGNRNRPRVNSIEKEYSVFGRWVGESRCAKVVLGGGDKSNIFVASVNDAADYNRPADDDE
jgi:hypothetical protein